MSWRVGLFSRVSRAAISRRVLQPRYSCCPCWSAWRAVVVLITLLTAVPAAYSLARLTGHWGEWLGIGIFMVYLIPPTLLFIPLARVVSLMRLQDSLWALVVLYPTFTIPFCTWLLMGFIK